MKTQFFASLLIMSLAASCKTYNYKSASNESFVKKWESTNFEKFVGFSLSLRSYDNNDPIILVYKDKGATDSCCYPYRIIIDSKTNQLKSSSRSPLDSSGACFIDTASMIKLALEFSKFQIAHLHIDSVGNVIIQTNFFFKEPNLI